MMNIPDFENTLNRLVTNNVKNNTGFSSEEKVFIEDACKWVLGRIFNKTSCGSCYMDTLIEVNVRYSKTKQINMIDSSFKLKNGAILRSEKIRDIVSFKNITDEVCVKFLYHHPELINKFSQVPDNLNQLIADYGNSIEKEPITGKEPDKVIQGTKVIKKPAKKDR